MESIENIVTQLSTAPEGAWAVLAIMAAVLIVAVCGAVRLVRRRGLRGAFALLMAFAGLLWGLLWGVARAAGWALGWVVSLAAAEKKEDEEEPVTGIRVDKDHPGPFYNASTGKFDDGYCPGGLYMWGPMVDND